MLLQGEAELYIRVFDYDSISDDLIVQYLIDPSPSVGSTNTFSTSSANRTAISLNVTVLCAPFYIGSSCEIFNHCESNAVTCSDRETCINGFNGFTCNCTPPYIGANCERANFFFNRNCIGVIMTLIPTPVSAMLTLILTPVTAMLAILVLIVRMILMSAC